MTEEAKPSEAAPVRHGPGPDLVLTRRVEELERDNRRLRRLGTYMLVGIGTLLGLTTSIIVVAARHGMPGFVTQVTESHSFLLRDADGQVRATLGVTKKGSAQLALQDSVGRERLRLSVLADGSSGATFVDSAGACLLNKDDRSICIRNPVERYSVFAVTVDWLTRELPRVRL